MNQCLLYMKPEKLVKYMKTKEGIIKTQYQEQKLLIKLFLYAIFFLAAVSVSSSEESESEELLELDAALAALAILGAIFCCAWYSAKISWRSPEAADTEPALSLASFMSFLAVDERPAASRYLYTSG